MNITKEWVSKPCEECCYKNEDGTPMKPKFCICYNYTYDYNGIKDCKCDSSCKPVCTKEEVDEYEAFMEDARYWAEEQKMEREAMAADHERMKPKE